MADVDKLEAKEAEIGSWVRTAKDLFSGAAGGVAQVLIGEFWDDGARAHSAIQCRVEKGRVNHR